MDQIALPGVSAITNTSYVAVDGSGNAVVAYEQYQLPAGLLVTRRRADGSWGSPVLLEANGAPAGEAATPAGTFVVASGDAVHTLLPGASTWNKTSFSTVYNVAAAPGDSRGGATSERVDRVSSLARRATLEIRPPDPAFGKQVPTQKLVVSADNADFRDLETAYPIFSEHVGERTPALPSFRGERAVGAPAAPARVSACGSVWPWRVAVASIRMPEGSSEFAAALSTVASQRWCHSLYG